MVVRAPDIPGCRMVQVAKVKIRDKFTSESNAQVCALLANIHNSMIKQNTNIQKTRIVQIYWSNVNVRLLVKVL